MLIVDAQIHLWEKGTPSPPHRQEPYSAAEAIAAMDRSRRRPGADPPGAVGPGFERAGDRSGAEISRSLPHHGLVLSRRPERKRPRRALERAAGHGRAALLFQRAAQAGVDDRRDARLAVARGRARRRAGGACRRVVPADRRRDRRAPPRPQIDRRPHGGAAGQQRRCRLSVPAGAAGARQIPERRGQGDGSSGLRRGRLSVPQLPRAPAPLLRRVRARHGCSGAPTSPGCRARGGNA